jgi:hypothetical protein
MTLVLADVEQGADVPVAQLRYGAGLVPQTGSRRAGRRPRLEHFDGNVALQPRIGRFVDLSHSPGANQCQDLIRPERLASEEDGRHQRSTDLTRSPSCAALNYNVSRCGT